ncbi:MAG: DNA-3-methyladenine glycosylase 2 family protein [Synergistaceae bacterium]|jgi:DNA-3-methyladenine glycosylase II|nr:DNA-3-methyladenine glycosylase 2 family protein [Synergistaceae bacterium]
MYFEYGEKEIAYLSAKDKTLGHAIEKIGHIDRPTDTDLFSSVIYTIIGQQISTAAHATVWRRINDALGEVTSEKINASGIDGLQKFGMTFRKAEYIKDFAHKVSSGEFDIESLPDKSDYEVISELSRLKGIGTWTAEMIMTFCMQRPDIFSYGDLAIHRGLRMLYHHKNIDKKLFEKYRRRYSPYGTVASLYIWAVAGGAIPEMRDYAPKETARKRSGK